MLNSLVSPRASNTGVVKPSINSLGALVDYVSFTFSSLARPSEAMLALGFDVSLFERLPHGRYGYLYGLSYSSISFYYGTPPNCSDMGVHMDVTGSGCRVIENFPTFENWQNFTHRLTSLSGHATRFDIAIDDFKGHLSLRTVQRSIEHGQYCGKFRRSMNIRSFELADGSSLGETIYFGSLSSDFCVRFYDKRSERLAKGFVDLPDFYNRYEVQLRRERADACMRAVASGESPANIVLGLLHNSISFRIDNGDSHKSRWPVAKWWARFVKDVEKVSFYKPPEFPTVLSKLHWVSHSTIRALAVIIAGFDGDADLIFDYLSTLSDDVVLTPSERGMVSAFNNSDHAVGYGLNLLGDKIYRKKMALQYPTLQSR